MLRPLFTIGTFLLVLSSSLAQVVLPLEDYLQLVGENHPISKQAQMLPDIAKARLQAARGGFDPKIFTTRDRKQFKGDVYFDRQDYGLKVPTWFGLEVKGGYQVANGVYLDPENTTKDPGLTYLGVSVPFAQGMLMDDRRATLRKAQVFEDQSLQEQYALINNLYFDATAAYWDWAKSFGTWQLYDSAQVIALQRFEQVKQRFYLGDLPAVDTLEAAIIAQNRKIQTQEAKQEYVAKTYKLNNFLWGEDQVPMEIGDSLIPQQVAITSTFEAAAGIDPDSLLNAVDAHPELITYNNKLKTLEIDRRLKAEKLKPKVNLQYNFLGEDLAVPELGLANYKYGFQFSFPIFIREARGNLRLQKFKIQQTEQKRMLKQREIQNKAMNYLEQVELLRIQASTVNSNADNYQRLLEAEQVKFTIGESSLFKVNAREIKVLEAQNKLLKAQAAVLKGEAKFLWSLGTLGPI